MQCTPFLFSIFSSVTLNFHLSRTKARQWKITFNWKSFCVKMKTMFQQFVLHENILERYIRCQVWKKVINILSPHMWSSTDGLPVTDTWWLTGWFCKIRKWMFAFKKNIWKFKNKLYFRKATLQGWGRISSAILDYENILK